MAGQPQKPAAGRHAPFYVGIVACLLTLPAAIWVRWEYAVEIAAVAFFLVYLVLTARRLPHLTAHYLKTHAIDTDEPAPVIFAVTFAAVAVSLGALFVVLNDAGGARAPEFLLAFASVALGWLTIHTMAAMHYAHLYWRPLDGGATEKRGLDFPETKAPGIYDFLYFGFVIGMTAQTSDVVITSTGMRKVNMLHAVVSFFFNTVLVAAAVNAAVSLAS